MRAHSSAALVLCTLSLTILLIYYIFFQMSRWKVDSERLYPKIDNPLGNFFYGYREIKLTLPDGQGANYFGVVVEKCVHVVALEDDDTTYLVRQSRPNVMEVGGRKVPETLELPGGFANPQMSLEDSAQAEVEEEIHRHADSLVKVGILWPSVGVSNEQDHIFLGRELSEITDNNSAEATEQDARIVDGKFSELYEQMLRERLPVSAQTLAAMAKVAILL